MANDKLNTAGESGGAAQRPAARIARRRPNMTINTERQFGDGLVTGGGVAPGAAQHMATHRARRTRKGDIFLRRCSVVFLLALTGVLQTRQYTVEYYLCWFFAYISFFFMLPAVLPTDNTRIKLMLLVASWNMACASAFAARFGSRKRRELAECDLEWCVCVFDVSFWAVHSILAFALAASSAYSIARRAPADGLNRFWFDFGIYFTCLSLLSALDFAVAYRGGKFHVPKYYLAFWGNLGLICLQFTIGRLCHSNRFKLAMWRYAATVASIRVHDNHPRSFLHRGLARWLFASVTLLFGLALFGTSSSSRALHALHGRAA
mmetsp:Transcript_23924/g.74850  ORF Transcript_23924/g.74850 Transcript_23924/m.74850 type:complete len:320 (-) Transcript_23924:144-1103(-)